MSTKKSLNTERFKVSVSHALKKLDNRNTCEEGQKLLKSILQENNSNDQYINLILTLFSEITIHNMNEEKIKTLVLFCENIQNISKYISKLLTILQNLISEQFIKLFEVLSSTYGEMVRKTLTKDFSQNEKFAIYEIFQGFCLYNMKQSYKSNQVCGSFCLSKLMENTNIFLENRYSKVIYENIIYHLDKQYFNGKKELMECIFVFSSNSESSFKPFAEKTIQKMFRFLTEQDWIKRKLALDIIYTIYYYCRNDVLKLKQSILEQIRPLKGDKNKAVRESCSTALRIIKEKKEDNEIRVLKNDSLKNTSFFSDDEEKYYNLLEGKDRSKSSNFDSNIKNNKMFISLENFQKHKKNNYINKNNEFNEYIIKTRKSENIKSVKSESMLKRNTTKSSEPNSIKIHSTKNRDSSNKKTVISIFKGPKNKEFFNHITKGVEILSRYNETEHMNTKERETEFNEEVNERKYKNPKKKTSNETSQIDQNYRQEETYQNPYSLNTENNHKEDNRNSNNNNTINEIIKQLKLISEKQIILMDSLQNLQEFTKDQVKIMNTKIEKIENFVYESLNHKKKMNPINSYRAFSSKDSFNKDIYSKSADSKEFKNIREMSIINDAWKSIQDIINVNPEGALKETLEGERIYLIKFIEKIENENISKISELLLERLIESLLIFLEKGEFTLLIVSWLKNIMTYSNLTFSQKIYRKIQDSLSFVNESKLKKCNYTLDQKQQINFILYSINNKLQKISEIDNKE